MKKIEKTVLLPDFHHPYHDLACWESIKKFLRWFQPHGVVILGDGLEMRAIDHWKKEHGNLRYFEGKRLLFDYEEFIKDILEPIERICPKAKKIYMGGNHEEWANLLINKQPALEGMIEPEVAMKLEERGWKWIPYRKVNKNGAVKQGLFRIGKLTLTHGIYLNKFHASRTADTFRKSTAYGHCHCFDKDTELLTIAGWKKYQDINTGDHCLTMNKKTRNLEWDIIKNKFVYDHDGKMIRIKGSRIDLLVDAEHGLFGKCCNAVKKINYTTAEELIGEKGDFSFKVSGGFIGDNADYPISDELLKLLAWVKSEGSICYKGNTPYAEICQSGVLSQGYLKEIIHLLKFLNFSFHLEERKGSWLTKLDAFRFRLHVEGSKEIIRHMPQKIGTPDFFFRLSGRQFAIFLDEYIKGDGTVYSGKEVKLLYSSDKEWIDALQEMLFIRGYSSTVLWRQPTHHQFPNAKPCGHMSIIKKEWHELKKKRAISIEHYKGKKWCVTVDNGTLVVRRNFKPVITQNTVQVYTKVHIEDPSDYHTSQSIGCLCNKSPMFLGGRPNRWVHAFGILYTRPTGEYNLYVPIIVNGKFTFADKTFGG